MVPDDTRPSGWERLRGGLVFVAFLLGVLAWGWYWVDQDNQTEARLKADLEQRGWGVQDISLRVSDNFLVTSTLEVFVSDGQGKARALCPMLSELGWDEHHDITVYYGVRARRWDRSVGLRC